MSVVNTAYSATNYHVAGRSAQAPRSGTGYSTAAVAHVDPASTVTLSDAAQAALKAEDFPTVVADARTKLRELLKEADRSSPLEDGKLALDMTSLNHRELYAIASNAEGLFVPDEQEAAGLEMQRRFEAAMAGPAAVSEVTGSWRGLYKAAASYLDSLGSEEKVEEDWKSARAAVTEALKQLSADPDTLPNIEDDPVALYLALVEAEETVPPRDFGDIASEARDALDKLYGDAIAAGRVPTFNENTTIGTYIDLSVFDSRMLSAIVLNEGGEFSHEEIRAAQEGLHARSGAALNAALQNAAKTGNPTAFSQNIISLYGAMTPEERQASGWTKDFYQAALESYQQTSKLLQMLSGATGGTSSLMSWFGR